MSGENRKRARSADDVSRSVVFAAGDYMVKIERRHGCYVPDDVHVADALACATAALYRSAQLSAHTRRENMRAKREAYARLAGREILGAIYAKYAVAFAPPADVHFARDSLDRALRVDGCTLHVRVDRMQRQTVTPPGDMRPFTAIVTALDIDLDQFVRDMHVAARGFSDAVLAVFAGHGVRVPASSIRTSDGRLKIDGVAVDVAPDATAPADAPPWTRSNIPPGFFAALFAAVDTLPAWPEVVWRASN